MDADKARDEMYVALKAFLNWVQADIDGNVSNHGSYRELQTVRDLAVHATIPEDERRWEVEQRRMFGPAPAGEPRKVCDDCGTMESDDQREFDRDCKCGGRFVDHLTMRSKAVGFEPEKN